jgi:magnesium-transporting ATPase (P-type)
MTDSEKWAIWTLGVVALTVAAYFTFVALRGSGPASQAVFALLALTAVPVSSRRYFKGRTFDEREREISGKALLAGFRALWVVFIGVVLTIGFVKGWDATLSLPMWMLSATLWWAMMLVLAVQAVTTLVLYRRGNHA